MIIDFKSNCNLSVILRLFNLKHFKTDIMYMHTSTSNHMLYKYLDTSKHESQQKDIE